MSRLEKLWEDAERAKWDAIRANRDFMMDGAFLARHAAWCEARMNQGRLWFFGAIFVLACIGAFLLHPTL